MNWYYYNVEKPALGQKIYFIRQFRKGKRVICEGTYGIMKKDGVHLHIGGGAYSAGPCPERDVTCWADQEEFDRNIVIGDRSTGKAYYTCYAKPEDFKR